MPAPIRSLPPPSKKRKTNPQSSSASIATRIQILETTVTSAIQSSSSLNPLADLLDLAHSARNAPDMSKAIYALYRVFVVLIVAAKLNSNVDDDEDKRVVRSWLWERLGIFQDLLVGLMKDEDKELRISSLQILFSIQKHLSSSLSSFSALSQPQFHVSHFKKIVYALIVCPPSHLGVSNARGTLEVDVRDCFVDTWFSVHDDVRWFFLREAVPVLQSHTTTNEHVPANLLSILERLTTFPTEQSELNTWWVPEIGAKPPVTKKSKVKGKDVFPLCEDTSADEGPEEEAEEDDWRGFFDEPTPSNDKKVAGPIARLHRMGVHQSLHTLPSHRAVFTRAWLALLPMLSLPTKETAADQDSGKKLNVRALNVMHRGVMPHLTRAILVMDWVGGCVDFGGTVGLLALNALFVLMTEYNLDYPAFYTRLYAFLDRDVLHSKHRARFFRLTELFLGSTHLPATLLASFIKRLSRLSMSAPPAAIVMIIPFTYNVLKRHPALMRMIHRVDDDNSQDSSLDPFKPAEPNPNITEAIDSSLWELYSHKRHYHSGVSTLAKIFDEAFTKPGYAMEDFLDHGYGTLLDTEVKRKIKKEPALGMEMRPDIFVDEPSDEEVAKGDVVNELWSFF